MWNAVYDRVLDDADLYNFGANWQQIFDVVPEMLSPENAEDWTLRQQMFTDAMDALKAYAEGGVERAPAGLR